MDPSLRIVTKIPLEDLWTDGGALAATRGRLLSLAEVKEILRSEGASFAIGEVGLPLRWFARDQFLDLWPEEIRPRLADPPGPWSLSSFRDERFYVASCWQGEAGQILLFEMHH